MTAVLLNGYGGFDCLDVRDDVPVPQPGAREVLVRVSAAGVNNTDINLRVGWYSKAAAEGARAAAIRLLGQQRQHHREVVGERAD